MKFAIACAAALFTTILFASEITPQQRALSKALQEYHDDASAFEELAARAASVGFSEAAIKIYRLAMHLNRGDMAAASALLPQIESTKDEILSQEFLPVTDEEFETLRRGFREVLTAWKENPANAGQTITLNRKKAQARSILEDLRRLDAASEKVTTEQNKPVGALIRPEVWRTYLMTDSRLWRTGRDCFGHEYGATFSGKPPMVNRASFERVKDVVSADFFKPFQISPR